MLNLIYGPPGSGKTYQSDSLLFKTLSCGKSVTLIVPEQEVIDTENRIFERAISDGVSLEKLNVVSFRRLANIMFRKYGGIVYNNIGDSGRLILLYKIISDLAPSLKVYNNPIDRTLIELLLSVCDELSRYCVTPSALESAANNATGALKDKLDDLALIFSSFISQISSKYADSTSDISRLAQIYSEFPPENDEIFFIDSFNGFTAPEFNVISQLIKSCKVTLSLNIPKNRGSIGYKTVEKTEKQLLNLAKDNSVAVNVLSSLDGDLSHSGTEFKLIRDKLFDFSYNSNSELSSENVSFVSCSDAFSQAEYLAISISELIRSGARYRDIAIITRNADRYDGVLDVVFEKYGIPLFLSRRDKITRTPIYKAIESALEIISGGYRTEDILAYAKSGICGFTMREIDALESYVSLWSINGKRWLDEEDWIMNPNGFTDSQPKNSSQILSTVNSVRNRIILPIRELADDLKGTTAKEACKSIYSFINKSGICDFYLNSKDKSDITAYNTYIDMLDTLALLGEDIPVNAQTLSFLLYLMAKNTDFGRIPTTLDRVTAGDASIIRCNGIKHVFLTDCENGVFPSSVSDDSFFSDSEKSFLLSNNIEISPNVDEKNDQEAFYFLRSACGATKTLTVLLCEKGGKAYKSVGYQRLQALFPANTVIRYPNDADASKKIQNEETFVEFLAQIGENANYDVLKELANELNVEIKTADGPISAPIATLTPGQIESLFGSSINMSYSSFERYVKCPFSYFCNYVLRLKEKKYNFFLASDMGTHIHRILEKAIYELFSEKEAKNITASDIERSVDKATAEVVSKIIGNDISKEGKRFEALLGRLKRTITLIAENTVSEFKNSDFAPRFYELKIGSGENDIPVMEISVDDKTTLKMRGVIDRVDTYENNGKTYVKIVDYKTGTREHSIKNIKYGLDTQMLIYLFSIWKSGNEKFKALLNAPDTEILPAGVLYQTARLPVTKTTAPVNSDLSLTSAQKKLVRKGVLLSDASVLDALENGLGGNFITAQTNSKGELSAKGTELVSIEGFEKLLLEVEDSLKEIGAKMKSGNACASPLKKSDVCRSCRLYPICRSKNNSESEADS